MTKKVKPAKVAEFECAELASDLDYPHTEHLIIYFDNGKEKIISYCLN